MIYERLRVFVSSRMQELAPERVAVKAALDTLNVDAWVFEADAGARPESIQETFLEEVERADLYLGLFWRGYGAYTVDEYEHATAHGKDCLIYEKRANIEGHREPALQAFLDRISQVEAGHTIQWFNAPEELGDRVKKDVAQWQVRTIHALRAARLEHTLSSAEGAAQRAQDVLLQKVQQFWIAGVLERSIHEEVLLDLKKDTHPDALAHPWESVLELPEAEAETLPPDQALDDLFDEVGRTLLILGAPGSGKTTTLLTLARDLLVRARRDARQPIPVVFQLATWTDPRQPLMEWLVAELRDKYQVPENRGRPWLEENRLVVLLDGLDEVAPDLRAACVEAINVFAPIYGLAGLAVCSRLEEYTALPVRLQFTGAIRLQPLTFEQVEGYLAQVGTRLAPLREALHADDVLRDLAKTPLMLSVMSIAYQDGPADVLTEMQPEAHRRHLFATYIDRMFKRRGSADSPFTQEDTMQWLAWLAQQMNRYAPGVFLIEHMQPTWLATRTERWSYILAARLVAGLCIGLLMGVLMGLFFWALFKRFADIPMTLQVGLGLGVSGGLIAGLLDIIRLERGGRLIVSNDPYALPDRVLSLLAFSLVGAVVVVLSGDAHALPFGFLLGLIFGVFFSFKDRLQDRQHLVQTVEALGWGWQEARTGGTRGLAIGTGVGLLFGLLIALASGTVALVHAPLFGLPGVLVGGLLGTIFGGLRGRLVEKTVPNQGIRLSMQNAALAGGIIGPSFGVLGGVVLGFWEGIAAAVFFAGATGLWYGGLAVIEHYLLRLFLVMQGHIPRRLVAFLDYATQLVFLQKVGGGYLFMHRSLQAHFATLDGQEDA